MMLDRKSTTSEFLHQISRNASWTWFLRLSCPATTFSSTWPVSDWGLRLSRTFCIPAKDRNLFILDLKEQLPSRQMMVAYNESLPVSQAARQFMDML